VCVCVWLKVEEINYLIVNPMQLNVKYAVVIIIFSTALHIKLYYQGCRAVFSG
jgi:hypothetical protein